MYGWTKEEAVGRVSHEILKTQFPNPPAEIEDELVDVGSWEGEQIHKRPDGTTIVVENRWMLDCKEQGDTAAILEINNDITEGGPSRSSRAGPTSWPTPTPSSSDSPTSPCTTSRSYSI
jgi:hypothetical protein